MKRIVILGATGSIGRSALALARARPRDYRIVGLSGFRNVRLLARQTQEFQPECVCVGAARDIPIIRRQSDVSAKTEFVVMPEGLTRLATYPEADIILIATSGIVSLAPTLAALRAGKRIALANKEPLVSAGALIMATLREHNAMLLPVDSEHSAIFQLLQGQARSSVHGILLTGSGGPFRGMSRRQMRAVTPAMALRHPKWRMGRKITIDSATLMNKGLELIEASWLFSLRPDQIRIVIHPEAIVHSLVEFTDGAVLAHLGVADMRLPIQYAFDYPARTTNPAAALDLLGAGHLTFERPDTRRFPCLAIAREVASRGGSAGCVMNAANEEAVELFLSGKCDFLSIPRMVETVLSRHRFTKQPALTDILALDLWAREEARRLCC